MNSDDELQDIGTPMKLDNSQILKDINLKVSHLSKTEQQDMKEILSEFNHIIYSMTYQQELTSYTMMWILAMHNPSSNIPIDLIQRNKNNYKKKFIIC